MARKVLKKLPKLPKLPEMNVENIIIIVLVIILIALIVVYITKRNEDFIGGNSDCKLMFFYADWCGYCKQAKPEVEKLVKILESEHKNTINGKTINVQYVNGDDEQELCSKFDVGGFPTFVLVEGEKNTTYEGDRESDALLAFLKETL